MRKKRSRSSRVGLAPFRRPRIWLYRVLAAALFTALLIALWQIGRPQSPNWGWASPFGRLLSGLSDVITEGSKADPTSWEERLGFLTLVIVFFVMLRRYLLARNAYLPGPIDVQNLTDATQDPTVEPHLEDLTAQLKEHLSKTHLYPPTFLPVEPPAETFLDLLGDLSADPKNIWAGAARAAVRMRPRVAYRVSGVLQIRRESPRYGITVTVTAFSLSDSRIMTLWADSWEEVVKNGGCWVMAAILPITRFCKTAPWADWRGRDLPWELFAHYQEAKRLSIEQQFDDALRHYYRALQYDPLNPHIRAEAASVEERLGLYVDALDSYMGAVVRDGQSTEDYNDRLWASRFGVHTMWYLRHLARRPDSILVRYRYAQILGYAEQIAQQWCYEGNGRRTEARNAVEKRLIPALAERYWPLEADWSTLAHHISYRRMRRSSRQTPAGAVLTDIRESGQNSIRELLTHKREKDVRIFFQRACLEEMDRLYKDRRLAWIKREARNGVTFTSLRIWRDALGPLRLAWARNDDEKVPSQVNPWSDRSGWLPHTPPIWARAETRSRLDWGGLDYVALDSVLRRSMGWRHVGSKLCNLWRDPPWQDYYNAACVYAVAMFRYDDPYGPLDSGERRPRAPLDIKKKPEDYLQEFEQRAISQLEAAVRGAESGFITQRQWWMLSNDPDLAVLRGRGRFADFATAVYPDACEVLVRPPKAISLQLTRYDARLIISVAGVMEESWHEHAVDSEADIHEIIKWIRSEKTVWEAVEKVAADCARHWPDRVGLLEAVDAVVAGSGTPHQKFHPKMLLPQDSELDTSQLRGSSTGDGFSARILDIEARRLANIIDDMLRSLIKPAGIAGRKCRRLIDEFEKKDEKGDLELTDVRFDEISIEFAAVWQRLAAWFELGKDGSPSRKARKLFTKSLIHLHPKSRIWSAA